MKPSKLIVIAAATIAPVSALAAPIYTGEAQFTFSNAAACGNNLAGAYYAGQISETMYINNVGNTVYTFEIPVNDTEQGSVQYSSGQPPTTYFYTLGRLRKIMLVPNGQGTFILAYNPVFAMNNLTYSGPNQIGVQNSYFTMNFTNSSGQGCSLKITNTDVKAGD